jgi:hypothetical protein
MRNLPSPLTDVTYLGARISGIPPQGVSNSNGPPDWETILMGYQNGELVFISIQ